MALHLQTSQQAMHMMMFQQLLCDDLSLGVYADLFLLTEPLAAHRHDFLEIAFMIKGCGYHEDVQGCVPFLSGDVWIIPPGQWHAYPCIEDDVSIFNVLLSQEFLLTYKSILLSLCCLSPSLLWPWIDAAHADAGTRPTPAHYLRLSPQGLGSIYSLLMTLASELHRPKETGNHGICVGLVLQTLGLLDRYGTATVFPQEKTADTGQTSGLLTALSYIEEHYTEPLTLEEIARQSGYVPNYLVRKFRHHLGTSPIDYLFQIRLQHACAHLKATDRSVTAIAYEVGFSDSRYFATRFRRAVGVSPSEFRARYKVNITNREDNFIEA